MFAVDFDFNTPIKELVSKAHTTDTAPTDPNTFMAETRTRLQSLLVKKKIEIFRELIADADVVKGIEQRETISLKTTYQICPGTQVYIVKDGTHQHYITDSCMTISNINVSAFAQFCSTNVWFRKDRSIKENFEYEFKKNLAGSPFINISYNEDPYVEGSLHKIIIGKVTTIEDATQLLQFNPNVASIVYDFLHYRRLKLKIKVFDAERFLNECRDKLEKEEKAAIEALPEEYAKAYQIESLV